MKKLQNGKFLRLVRILNSNNFIFILATCFASPIWAGEEKIKGVNYQVKVLKQMGPSLKIVFGLQNSNF